MKERIGGAIKNTFTIHTTIKYHQINEKLKSFKIFQIFPNYQQLFLFCFFENWTLPTATRSCLVLIENNKHPHGSIISKKIVFRWGDFRDGITLKWDIFGSDSGEWMVWRNVLTTFFVWIFYESETSYTAVVYQQVFMVVGCRRWMV